MKQQIIDWILSWKTASFTGGVELVRQIDTESQLIGLPETLHNRQTILKVLGNALKNGIPPGQTAVSAPATGKPSDRSTPSEASAQEGTASSEASAKEDNVSLSTRAKLALDIDSLIRSRTNLHRQVIAATTNHARRQLISELVVVQDRIEYNADLIKKIEAGEKISLEGYIQQEKEDDFEIPERIDQHLAKLNHKRASRSRRKKILDTEPEGSEKYEKALKEWAHYDKAVKHLDENYKIRTKGS